ncbi:hypothetical protein AB6A40_007494 [Gnathostoma spinigerum]|uniref:EGF-like domain-containing protein n=1 Tax=Gnathostoma spinigerum TaxID=75299 RepID=A0ABD6EMM2_9BILA
MRLLCIESTHSWISAYIFTVFIVDTSIPDTSESSQHQIRFQKIYFICGAYPNFYFEKQPCYLTATTCLNGGISVGTACNSEDDCKSSYKGDSVCINGQCCTNIVPSAVQPVPSNNIKGYCQNGQLSEVTCNVRNDCELSQTCLNGLCCTETKDDDKYACGGVGAVNGLCVDGRCANGYTCTSSGHCCECEAGITGGVCKQGLCPQGYTCTSNNFCCASCPLNTTLYGACSNGLCGGSTMCYPGNICCG